MSTGDESKEGAAEENLEPLTESDLHVVLQMLVGLTTMGACEIRFHPCRFPLLFDALLRHGVVTNPEDLAEDMSEVSIPILAPSSNPDADGPLECVVTQWKPCDKPNCEGCRRIIDQAPRYPVPPKERRVWTPGTN